MGYRSQYAQNNEKQEKLKKETEKDVEKFEYNTMFVN